MVSADSHGGNVSCWRVRIRYPNARRFAVICLGLLFCAVPALAQAPQSTTADAQQSSPAAIQAPAISSNDLANAPTGTGSISGTIVDQTGNAVSGARVILARGSAIQETISDDDGQFFFVNVAAGPFRLNITAPGFAAQSVSGIVHGGEAYTVQRLTLAVTGVTTQVQVMPTAQLAEIQVKQQEKQRVLGGGPRYRKFGRRVRYAIDELEGWANQRSHEMTSEPDYVTSR